MYNCVNLCYCRVLSNELDSQIHWSLGPRRETFVPVPKNLRSTIYKISSNQANFNENPSMQAELWKFCKQVSTSLIFGSKSSKGQILQVLENFKRPFNTPCCTCFVLISVTSIFDQHLQVSSASKSWFEVRLSLYSSAEQPLSRWGITCSCLSVPLVQ